MNKSEFKKSLSGNGHSANGHSHNGHHKHEDELLELDDRLHSPELLRRFDLGHEPVDPEQVRTSIHSILHAVDEDPQREGLLDTPARVAKAYQELLSGYSTDPAAVINNAVFEAPHDDMVVVRDIEYFSLCEHHMLPFMGHAHVAYIPNKKIIGLSKIPRIVDMFSRRLQVQERLTRQIAEFLHEVLDTQGVAVVMDGTHMCSMMRGVQKCHSGMTTSALLGLFRSDRDMRTEFMGHIQRAGGQKSFM